MNLLNYIFLNHIYISDAVFKLKILLRTKLNKQHTTTFIKINVNGLEKNQACISPKKNQACNPFS